MLFYRQLHFDRYFDPNFEGIGSMNCQFVRDAKLQKLDHRLFLNFLMKLCNRKWRKFRKRDFSKNIPKSEVLNKRVKKTYFGVSWLFSPNWIKKLIIFCRMLLSNSLITGEKHFSGFFAPGKQGKQGKTDSSQGKQWKSAFLLMFTEVFPCQRTFLCLSFAFCGN